MAAYWSASAPRVPWDRDGSILTYWGTNGVVTRLPQSAMSWLARESSDNSTTSTTQLTWNMGGATPAAFFGIAIIFPFQRDLEALFSFGTVHPPTGFSWQTSHNTTNGLDGTWDTQASPVDSVFMKPFYRTPANLVILSVGPTTKNVRGVRLQWNSNSNGLTTNIVRAMHVYGWPSASATTERLEFWHPTSNVILPASWLDYGSFPRGTSADKKFRIKNLSATSTANSVSLQVETPSDTSPSVVSSFSIGDAGGTFATVQTIPSIAPGAISPVYTLRRVTPVDAQLSVWSSRLNTTVSSWT